VSVHVVVLHGSARTIHVIIQDKNNCLGLSKFNLNLTIGIEKTLPQNLSDPFISTL
jgi:hypothetical protein